jgi:hypothetical protein
MEASGQRDEEVLESHLVGHVDEAQARLLLSEPANDCLQDSRLPDAAVTCEAGVLAFEQEALERGNDFFAADEGRGGGLGGRMLFLVGILFGGLHGVPPGKK